MADTYLFAGGGTGGHLYPALAVIDALRAMQPDAQIVFACSRRPIDRRILDPLPLAICPQEVLPLPRRPWHVPGFYRAWRASRRQMRRLLRDVRPAAVLGTGGYAAGPAIVEAARAGIRTALLNPDAVPGVANRYLSARAQVIFTQFASSAAAFRPAVRQRVKAVGCPIRPSLALAIRQEALTELGLAPQRRTLLILGGSLGAASINEAFAPLAADLDAAAGWQVLHITGPGKGGSAAACPCRTTPVLAMECCDRMDLALGAADLAVCRAGAATVAELAATGTPAILLPYPYHRDQHQRHNAAALAQAGGAIVVDDARAASANAARLRDVLAPLLRDTARLDEMSRRARQAAAPHAARRVAEWMTAGVGGGD